jgi:phospholipase C
MGGVARPGRRCGRVLGSLLAAAALPAAADSLDRIRHFVVIYEENHSFDNLYGGWEHGRGLTDAAPAAALQVSQHGVPYACLLQPVRDLH